MAGQRASATTANTGLAGKFRRAGAAAGSHWHLWCDCLFGETAYARTRHSHGVRGTSPRHITTRYEARAAFNIGWHRHRSGGNVGANALAGNLAVRRAAKGLGDLRRSRSIAGIRGIGGMLDSGAASYESR